MCVDELMDFSPAHSCNPMLFGGFTSIEASIVELFADIHPWIPTCLEMPLLQCSNVILRSKLCSFDILFKMSPHILFGSQSSQSTVLVFPFCFHVLNILIVVSFAHWCQIMSFWTSQLFNCCSFLFVFILCSGEFCLSAFQLMVNCPRFRCSCLLPDSFGISSRVLLIPCWFHGFAQLTQ